MVPSAGLYRPLTTLSYLLNFAVLDNGARPEGYHFLNLLLHIANVSLVYALGLAIFESLTPALALAAIWGLHPLLTESITNIVGRADLLAALGVLAGLLCYTRSISASGRRRYLWMAGLAAAQTVGIFSKESAAVLPGLMLLYDLAWPDSAKWRERVSAYAVLLAPFTIFFYLRSQVHPHMLIPFDENPMLSADFWTARLTAIKVIGKIIWLFLWPAHLSADYSFNAIPLFDWRVNWEDAKALIAGAVCIGMILLAIRSRRMLKPVFFFIGFFFIAYSPTSNILLFIGSIMAERFAYLPAIGLVGCSIVFARIIGRRLPPRAAWIAISLVCVVFAARTYARNLDWRDDLSLWSSAVSVCPQSAKAHFMLGSALARIPERLPDAGAEYETALRIRPQNADTRLSLANVLARMPGRIPAALDQYEAVLRIRPRDADAQYNFGNALAQNPDKLADAIARYREAIRIDPAFANAHYNLANVLARMPGHLPEAMEEWKAAIEIQPGLAKAHNDLANALAQMPGRMPEAIAEWRKAARAQPDFMEAHYNLGNALAQTPATLPEAAAELQAAVRIRPDLAEAHNNLATVLARLPGRLPDAIREWQTALRMDPNLAQAHYNLGRALVQMDRGPEAIRELEAAYRARPDPETRQLLDRLREGRK